MDRRQRKLEQKKKKRDLARKEARIARERRPSAEALLVRAAARSPFGPCAINADWTKEGDVVPSLVTVVITRQLPSGELLPCYALVDRTCLGIKDAFVARTILPNDYQTFLEKVQQAFSGGAIACEPLVAQSVVFHALDYAQKLGFAPHPDFDASLFGPRPEKLLDTPWHAPEKPLYVSGPDDNQGRILRHLRLTVGDSGFTHVTAAENTRNMLNALMKDAGDASEDEEESADDNAPELEQSKSGAEGG